MEEKLKTVCENEVAGREALTETLRVVLLKTGLEQKHKRKKMCAVRTAKRFKGLYQKQRRRCV